MLTGCDCGIWRGEVEVEAHQDGIRISSRFGVTALEPAFAFLPLSSTLPFMNFNLLLIQGNHSDCDDMAHTTSSTISGRWVKNSQEDGAEGEEGAGAGAGASTPCGQ